MPINISQYNLLPVRRDKQVGSGDLGGSGSFGGSGGGGSSASIIKLPILVNATDSSLAFYWEASTNSIRTPFNIFADGEVGAWTSAPAIPNWQNGLFKEASIGTGFYWLSGLLNASTGGGGTGDLTLYATNASLYNESATIYWLLSQQFNDYATIASIETAGFATNSSINTAAFAKNASLGLYVQKAGDTMSGNLTINASLFVYGLGIGTTAPTGAFHLKQPTAYARVESTNAGSNAMFYFITTQSQFGVGANMTSSVGDFEIYDYYANTSRLWLTANGNTGAGNFGIGGFVAPLSKLCINGGLHVGGESAVDDNNLLVDGIISLANGYTSTHWSTAYTHTYNNYQAHTDYLVNNANDTTSGVLTAGGFATAGNITAAGEITGYYTSDERLKFNIKPFTALDIINKLKPKKFKWNDKAKELNSTKDDRDNYGLIAQDVEKIIPELIHPIYEDYKAVDYVQLVPILIQAVNELNKKVTDLEQDLNYYKNKDY